MVKKTLINIYRALFWALGLCLLLVAIAALIIQFFIFPNINQYKDDIANYVSKTSGKKIQIGEIKVDWKKFDPHLNLSNITLFDAENRPALQLNDTDVLVSWLSIPKFEPHFAELRIQNPELTVRRAKNGEIFIAGISTAGPSKPDTANWLLRQSKLKIRNAKIVWLDEMRNAPPLSLDNFNLELFSPPWKSLIKHHRLSISATPSVGTKTPITLFSEFYGSDISKLNTWRGEVTTHLKNAKIPDFKAWIDYPFELQSAAGDAEIHLTFAKNAIQLVTANLSLNQLNMQLKPSLAPVMLDQVSGKISWENTPEKRVLVLKKFNIKHQNLQLNNINATYTEDLQKKPLLQSIALEITQLDLTDVQNILNILPITPVHQAAINKLAPVGQLKNLTFNWVGNASKTISYQLATKFNQLGITATENIPGFSNITGEVKADEKSGLVKLNSTLATLDFKEVLRFPTPADKLNGTISWTNSMNGKNKQSHININQLNIKNAHLQGVLSGKLLIDDKGQEANLKGSFEQVDLAFAKFYYPTLLGEDTLHWLDTSILSGTGNDVELTLKGRLDQFPFVDSKNNLDLKKGLFRVTANIKNGVVEYGSDWPKVEDLDVKMLFEGDRMVLTSHKGRLLGNQIEQATITIPQLDAAEPMLVISGDLNGPVSEGVLFVNKSPVATLTQGFTDNLKSGGQALLNLNLNIPLNHVEDAKFKGLYQVTNGNLASDDIPALSQINGNLEFTEESLTANNVKAVGFGAPLVLNISSGKDKLIKINTKGKLNNELLQQVLTNANHYLTGSADFNADIVVQKPQVTMSIQSDLVGLTSYLPAPFNKNANERMNFVLEKKQALNGELLSISAGNLLSAKIVSKPDASKSDQAEMKVENINIRLNQGGSQSVDTPPNNEFALSSNTRGIHLRGNLDYLDADAWRNVMKDLLPNSKSSSNSLPFQRIAVQINSLDAFDRRFNQLKISNKSNKEGFQATVESRELSGLLQWQNENNGKLIARLTNFMIPDDSPKRVTVNPLMPAPAPAKSTKKLNEIYPAIDIISNQFIFKNKNMGSLELVADPQDNNWNIEKFKLINPDSTLSADGAWTSLNKDPMTKFNVNWDIQDLGKTLQRLGYPDTIKGGEGELKGQLNWAGSPHEFDVLALNGNLKFEMRKGQILKVQPGVGRLLGLLSLQSLPRRLTLDFRDLFSNGFAFDSINARVNIDKGVMRSDNFKMTGPAADVTITGETNLKNETQRLSVKVLPHISDSLSLAALAGGPLAGAVAFLAQKVLKDPLNQIASSQYEIIGTWDNPQEIKTETSPVEKNPANIINK
jgi:uncharacterized protein (TIGR02099 family)